MDLCQQSNISAFKYAVKVAHSFSSKEQKSFDFMAVVTICSDFGAPQNKVCHCFHRFPIYLPWSDGTGCCDLSFWNADFFFQFFFHLFLFVVNSVIHWNEKALGSHVFGVHCALSYLLCLFILFGSEFGMECVNAVYCHPAYLNYVQGTSWEIPGWMKHKLQSR